MEQPPLTPISAAVSQTAGSAAAGRRRANGRLDTAAAASKFSVLPLPPPPTVAHHQRSHSTASYTSAVTRALYMLRTQHTNIPFQSFLIHPDTAASKSTIVANRTVKKLAHFFGEVPSADVTVGEIKRGGLKVLLRSRLPLCYFLRFLLDEYSSENLFALLEIQHYQLWHFRTAFERRQAAHLIVHTFIAPAAPLEVNLTAKCRSPILKLSTNEDTDQITLQHCFIPAADAILLLLEDSYQRFENSLYYAAMDEELGYANVFGQAERNRAIKPLLTYLKKSSSGEISSAIQKSSQSPPEDLRHRALPELLICELVADFCQSTLGMEVERIRLAEQDGKSTHGFSGRLVNDFQDANSRPVTPPGVKEAFEQAIKQPNLIPAISVQPSRRMPLRRTSSVEMLSPSRLTFFSQDGHNPPILEVIAPPLADPAPPRASVNIMRSSGKHLKILGVESDSELFLTPKHPRSQPGSPGKMKLQRSIEALFRSKH